MKRMTWLDDYKDIIICLYNEGMKQTEIAEEFEVSQTAIGGRLIKWGASNSDGNRFIRVEIDKETLYDLYWNKEMHPDKIGKLYGCTKMSITRKMIAYGIPMRTKSQARMGKLNPIYNVGHSEEARKKMSDAYSNGRTMGFSTNWSVGAYYNTPNQGKVWMRSGWEVKVADYLTKQGIDWYYEYKWVILSNKSKYLPDFYIPYLDLYIEIKGRKKEIDMQKFNRSQAVINVLLWDGEELLRRGIIDNSGCSDINKKYRNAEKYIDNWEDYN